MITLDYLAVIDFSGKDAGVFLHNQLTEDINGLSVDEATFACLCQPNGRVIAVMLVQATSTGYRVLCHRSLAPGLVQRLKLFVLRDDVQIRVCSELRVAGVNTVSAPNHDMLTAHAVPELHYRIIDAAQAGSSGTSADWKAAELARGVLWLNEESSAQFLPQMLGMENIGALNFRKGCFPGQEVVARTRYLGKLKRHPWVGTIMTGAELASMQSVELHGDNDEAMAKGALVDQATRGDGSIQLFVVARVTAPFEVLTLVTDETTEVITGQWLPNAAGNPKD